MATGTNLAYIGGTTGRPLPPRGHDTTRRGHAPQAPKATGLDFTALAPTCTTCRERSGSVNTATGLCATCATPAPKTKPTKDPTCPPTSPTKSAPTSPTSAPAPTSSTTTSPPTPAPPHSKPTPRPTATAPTTSTASSPATSPPPSPEENLDAQVTHAARVLHDTAKSTHPAVAAARTSALAALEALHLTHEITQTPAPAATPQPTADTAPTRKRRPARREHNGPRRHQLPPDTCDRYQNGATTTQLAAEYGVSIPTIRRWLTDHGTTLRSARVTYTPELLDQIRHLYVDRHMTQAEIANRLGHSTKVIQTAMTQAGIDRRDARARTAADNARNLKTQITNLGVTARHIKTWALDHGLVDTIHRGLPSQALVDAYTAAHTDRSRP